MTNPNRRNIVLLGIGHTNAHVVKEWAIDPIPNCNLICISKFPSATYSGMLPGTLGWQFTDDEMRIDLGQLTDHAGAELILADTVGLDLQSGHIHFSDHDSISFDALSIGVGSIPAGCQQHAESSNLVPTKPMQTFLSRLQSCLDKAEFKHQRVAIVGGGVASVEIALCLDQQCKKRGAVCDLTIEIFTSGDQVADGMSRNSVNRISKLLVGRDIKVHLNRRVIEVDDAFLTTEDGQRHGKDNQRHDVDCVIWATGAAPPPVLGKLGLQTDDRGFIATSDTLQSLTDPRIFAVGDSGTVVQSPSPKAGVYAVRQCPILWHNLRSLLEGSPMHSFKPQSDFLKILNTGDGKALLEYGWIAAHGRWCWKLKTWIDKRFVTKFQTSK